MEYFVISAEFVPLKYYTLSSQLRRLTSFSVGLFGSANSVTWSYPVMQKSCIHLVIAPKPSTQYSITYYKEQKYFMSYNVSFNIENMLWLSHVYIMTQNTSRIEMVWISVFIILLCHNWLSDQIHSQPNDTICT